MLPSWTFSKFITSKSKKYDVGGYLSFVTLPSPLNKSELIFLLILISSLVQGVSVCGGRIISWSASESWRLSIVCTKDIATFHLRNVSVCIVVTGWWRVAVVLTHVMPKTTYVSTLFMESPLRRLQQCYSEASSVVHRLCSKSGSFSALSPTASL